MSPGRLLLKENLFDANIDFSFTGLFCRFSRSRRMAFAIDRLGLWRWVAWFNRRESKPGDNGSGEYWRVR